MSLQASGSTAISDVDGTSSIVDVSEVDSTDPQVGEVDATASFRNNDISASSSYSNDQQGYCYCGKVKDYDDMIFCDSRDCVIKWFHFMLTNNWKRWPKVNIIVQTATS